MKVAVTGSKGFLGKCLIDFLKTKNIDVTEFDHTSNNLFDIKSLEGFVKGQNAIIHLAAVNRDTDENIIKVNLLGTAGLLEAIKQYNPKARFIFSSTAQVYNQKNFYGVSKRDAEKTITWYATLFNINAIILRVSNIYGPSGKPFYNSVIATFIHLINTNKTLTINGDGEQKRDYIFVTDVAQAIYKALMYKNKKMSIFDICSNKKTSLNTIVEILQTFRKDRIRIQYKGNQENEEIYEQSNLLARKELLWKPEITLKKGLYKAFYE